MVIHMVLRRGWVSYMFRIKLRSNTGMHHEPSRDCRHGYTQPTENQANTYQINNTSTELLVWRWRIGGT
jgi:hypothetical protein